LIPVRARRRRYPGRKPIPDRLVLNGILHVLHTGIAWEDLPQEYGYGSGVTAWRRLRDWQQAGVWDALHQHLLTKLNAAGAIDWSRAAVENGRRGWPHCGRLIWPHLVRRRVDRLTLVEREREAGRGSAIQGGVV